MGAVTARGDVVFSSAATNLVTGDTNNAWDVFYRPRIGAITRVSVTSAGGQANGGSGAAYPQSVSRDGRYVLFFSTATNLGYRDTNKAADTFVRDRVSEITYPVGLGNTRIGLRRWPNAGSRNAVISEAGLTVAFDSTSTNIATTRNTFRNIFVREVSSTPAVYLHIGGPVCKGPYVPELFPAGWAVLGNDGFGFDLIKSKPHSLALLLVALTTGTTRLGPCHIGVQFPTLFVLPATSNAQGAHEFWFALPRLPILRGLNLFVQGASYDDVGPGFGFSLTGTKRSVVQD